MSNSSILTSIKSKASNLNWILFVYFFVSLIAVVHRWLLGPDHFQNFLIFREATFNFFEGNDLYNVNTSLGITLDLFKYSPAFAFLFSPFAYLPLFLGYLMWNLLNVLSVFFALKFSKIPEEKKWIVLWIVLIDLITALQNSQSNGLMAALMIMAFSAMENSRPGTAAWLLVASVFIKLFSVVGFLMFLFYPNKVKAGLHSFIALLFFSFVPLLVLSFSQLEFLYISWGEMLRNDQDISWGISFMGILKSWFNLEFSKTAVQLTASVLLVLPLMFWKSFKVLEQRLLFLSSLLLWVIIFNHRAESNSFIIAMCGIAIWWSVSKNSFLANALILFALLFITFSPTDLFPRFVRVNYIVPFCLKALPAVIIWFVVQFEMYSRAELFMRKKP